MKDYLVLVATLGATLPLKDGSPAGFPWYTLIDTIQAEDKKHAISLWRDILQSYNIDIVVCHLRAYELMPLSEEKVLITNT